LGGKIKFELILKEVGSEWTGFVWLRIGTTDEVICRLAGSMNCSAFLH
jgi:hypothetical protein